MEVLLASLLPPGLLLSAVTFIQETDLSFNLSQTSI